MPRFNNLEMDQPSERPEDAVPAHEGRERDERYWLGLADENRRQGHFENALRFYSRALEVDKSLVHAWLGQAQMLIALDENPEADIWAKKALELFRNNAELMAARAQALARIGDRSQSLSLCDAALKQEGQSAYRWMVRGELFIHVGRDIDKHCFDKALLIDSDWLVPLEMGATYQYYGVPSKASQCFRKAIERAANQPLVWLRKGQCEIEMDLDSSARQSLARCLELVPRHTEAMRSLEELENRGWSLRRTLRRLLRWRR